MKIMLKEKFGEEYKEVSMEKLMECVDFYHHKDDCRPVVLEKVDGDCFYYSVEVYEC